MTTRLVSMVLVVSSLALAGPPAPKKKYLSVSQTAKLLEDSPLQYAINMEKDDFDQWRQQNAERFWPSGKFIPAVMLKNGKLVPYENPPEISKLVAKVEPLFEAKDYDAALKGYDDILARHPDTYSVMLAAGDALLFGGKPKLAVERYVKAGKVNSADYRSWFYRGNAYAALGQKEDALQSYAQALARCQTCPLLVTGAENTLRAMGGTFRGRVFLPAVRVEKIEKGYEIRISKKSVEWLAFGTCKAMWRGEASHRKSVTGDERDQFSIDEEKECLAQVADFYATREKKNEVHDPAIEQFLASFDDDLMYGFLMFEIVTRIDPHAFLFQDEALQRLTVAYIRKYVLLTQ
ncbi:MAG: tetratricopeptide repeat protein [Archangium sp.]|nr:tetratricopeptide repeat protein [Archangium sp.]